MSANTPIEVATEHCTGCGLCVTVCPHGTIAVSGGKAALTGAKCMECGHCEAACPAEAVRLEALDDSAGQFSTFSTSEDWIPFGKFDTGELVRLMRSRRSIRNYKDTPVATDLLHDLVKVGVTAPSGTNSQKWAFTLLPERKDVLILGNEIGRFFRRLNRLAENFWLRNGLRLLGKPALHDYRRDHLTSVKTALELFETQGRDLLFHGAPAAIIVSSRSGASCPAEDALLATQNILLAAHSMGLGTCLIGYAVEAMKHDATIQKRIGIPANETVHSVIALGHPDETYTRVAGRKAFAVRTFTEE